MLFRFEIENFCSIREPQVIDLLVSRAAAAAEPERLLPIGVGLEQHVPSVVAFLGPNAAGKSNVLKALTFLAWFIRQGFSLPPDSHLPLQKFLDVDSQQRPTRFMVWFTGPGDLEAIKEDPYEVNTPETKYAYELVIAGSVGKPQVVLSETLRYWPLRSNKQVYLFRRDGDRVNAHSDFGLSRLGSVLEVVLRHNVSVISTLAQLNHPLAKALWHFASQLVSNIFLERTDFDDTTVARIYQSNPELLRALNDQIERVDFGIQELSILETVSGPTFAFRHNGLVSPILFNAESHGTRHFVKVFPLIYESLLTGSVALIDEIDISIHPNLLPEILGWFRDPRNNENRAQLWITCQSATVLEHLIKEEIFFCEKDRAGRTEVYGLRDIHSVRRGDNFYRKYLDGVYGAVPQVG